MPDVPSPRVSLVVPVYNEEECLPGLMAELAAALSGAAGLEGRYEIVLVDDGSTDGTAALMDRLAAADARVRVVRFRKNAGQTAAFDAGFKAARGDAVVTLDADGQNDPADISRLLSLLEQADAVCGIRANRRDSWVRRLSSRIGNSVRNWATGEDIVDTGCSLKAFRRQILGKFQLYTGMHRFLPTLVRLAGGTVLQTPVHHRPRQAGTAKYGVGNRMFRTVADLLAVVWMKRRWLRYEIVEETKR
ncbi:MAG: glycosyltransferase family 2 protein [Candidatus Wallbacteria bacterium]|nr:glycosyltransferase family 2 protein [Candidatus Wallbacteria bacterium]